jgi:glutamine synthetase
MAKLKIDLDNSTAETIAAEVNAMMSAVDKLSEAMEKEDFASTEEHMQFCANDIRGLMDEVRAHADTLEAEVSDELWPLPKYQEMLFIK